MSSLVALLAARRKPIGSITWRGILSGHWHQGSVVRACRNVAAASSLRSLALVRFGRARATVVPAGRKIEQSRPARVLQTMKGHVAGPIRIRGIPWRSVGGICGTQMNSCQVSVGLDAARTGPLLFRRVAPAMFEPLDVCTKAAFTTWCDQRRNRRATPRTTR